MCSKLWEIYLKDCKNLCGPVCNYTTIFSFPAHPFSLLVNRCGIPNELTAPIGMAEKAGAMTATVEVTNGRGDLTVVRKKTGIVNHIISLKTLIGK